MRRTAVAVVTLGLVWSMVGPAIAAPGPDRAAGRVAEMPRAEPARGVVTTGLVVATEGPCLGLLEVVDAPGRVCTHGPDPAPAHVGDVRTADLDSTEAAAEVAAAPPFACEGDGISGRRAHAIYAVAPDRADRFATYEPAFRSIIASVQEEYRQSSLLHGATDPLVYRFTHTTPVDGACQPLLDHVTLPSTTDDDSFGKTIAALESMGYTDPSRRYMVFVDANVLCGIGQMYGDDRAGASTNWNNVLHEPLFSRVDAPCWGYAETHELTHNIGAVQDSAPHATGLGHCNDDHDLMCYADGGPWSLLTVVAECGLASLWEKRLDCGGDDYFNPSPATGSYLDTHWNIADSGWLFTETVDLVIDDGSGATDDESGTTIQAEPEPPPPAPSNPPGVSISTPTAGVTNSTITVSGTSSDKDGDLEAVRVFVDGKRVGTLAVGGVPTGGNWSQRLQLTPGERVISAQAVDGLGNISKKRSVQVTALYDMPSDDLFADDDTSPFEPAIERLAVQGVTRGCNPPTNDRFCPTDVVTRGQMAAFLARALSLPAGSGIDFRDDDRSMFEDAIERLATAGITRGCNPPANDRFCPDQTVTRGQMAAFLARALALPAGSGIDFRDDDGSTFEDAIERLAAAGITRGCNPPANTEFCPDAPVTRGQMAAFLTRALYS